MSLFFFYLCGRNFFFGETKANILYPYTYTNDMLCWNICMRYPWNQLVTLILVGNDLHVGGFNSPI